MSDNMRERVEHPKHYQVGKFETVDVIEEYVKAADGLYHKETYHFATAMKYLLRAPFKGRKEEDLEKCMWHIKRWISLINEYEGNVPY